MDHTSMVGGVGGLGWGTYGVGVPSELGVLGGSLQEERLHLVIVTQVQVLFLFGGGEVGVCVCGWVGGCFVWGRRGGWVDGWMEEQEVLF